MALPPLPFGRRASNLAIIPRSPPDVNPNIDPRIYSQERNSQFSVATWNIWAHAIPCPYRWWYTVEPFSYSAVYPLPPASRYPNDPRRTYEIPTGLYFVPYLESGGDLDSYYVSNRVTATRSLTMDLHLGQRIEFQITKAAPVDDIVVTFVVSGTGGYTVTRTYPASSQLLVGRVVAIFYIPTPWDDDRTVTLTWTGGGTTVSASSTIYAPNGIVLTSEIPNGAVANGTWDGRRGTVRSYESLAQFPMTAATIREHHRYGDGGTNYGVHRQINDVGYGGNKLVTYEAKGAVLGSFGMRSLFYVPPYLVLPGSLRRILVNPTDALLPFIGLPVLRAGEFKTTSVSKPVGNAGLHVVRRCVRLYFQFATNFAGTYTLRMYRGVDWSNDFTTKTTVATISVYHPGSPGVPQFYEFLGPYPLGPDPDGAYCGMVGFDNITEPSQDQVGGWILDDFLPTPISIPTTDGRAIPASVVLASLVPAKLAQPIAVSGVSFPFTSVPSDVELYYLKFTNVPRGFYWASGRTGADVDAGLAMLARGTSEVQDSPGSVVSIPVETGDPVFVLPPPQWGNYTKSTRTDRTIDTVKLMVVTPAHNALVVGDNDVSATYASWGYSSDADRSAIRQLFQKFTAPNAGVYRFVLWTSYVATHTTVRLGLWASVTDDLCLHDPPDAVDVGGINAPGTYAFVAAPASETGSVNLVREYVVVGGTGVFAGHDGELAYGYYAGVPAIPITWRFAKLPQGWNVIRASDSKLYRLEGAAFEVRNTSRVVYTAVLTAGQTLYVRAAAVRTAGAASTRYGGSLASMLLSGYYRMTVTDVTP